VICDLLYSAVYFETTDIAVASKPFYSDMWKALSFMSPILKELQEISKKLPGKHYHILHSFLISSRIITYIIYFNTHVFDFNIYLVFKCFYFYEFWSHTFSMHRNKY